VDARDVLREEVAGESDGGLVGALDDLVLGLELVEGGERACRGVKSSVEVREATAVLN
jgi:hypothetical protein